MTAILGRTGNLVGFTTGRGTTPWNTEMEAALRKMDAMLASTVVAITNTLPGSANEGDLYLVGTSPTGVAAGWANRIARWRSSPAGWEAYQPMQGWIVTIVGETTDKIRRYNGTAWVALAADTGAEPYAGVPAQTSFWRSTAAGVRAWVQLVAADITDLTTTLAGYLTKTNPTFTGTMTGPSLNLSSGTANSFMRFDASKNAVASSMTESGTEISATSRDFWARSLNAANAAADPVGNGSNIAIQDSKTGITKGWLLQLGASNDMALWNYASGSWTKRWQFLSDGSLSQGGTTRITAGGGGRLADLKIAELGASSGKLLMSTDANGTVGPSQLTQGWQTIGNVVGVQSLLSGYLHGFSAAGGSVELGGQYWNTWQPSVLFVPSDDTYVNPMPMLYAGGMWHSQISNALTIADGDASTGSRRGYRGRLKADRWVGTSVVSISGTTTATSFFAGAGDGSPTIPVYYLKQGRRGSIKSSIYCGSASAGSSHALALTFGPSTVFTRTITPSASGNQGYRFEGDFFLSATGSVDFIGTIRAYTNGVLWAEYAIRNSLAYTSSAAYTLDMTIKPYSVSEGWQRDIAIVEI